MPVDFSLLQPVDIGGLTMQGFQTGRAMVKQIQAENALRSYVKNPDDPQAFSALAVYDPDMAYKLAQTKALKAKTDAEAQELVLKRQLGGMAASGDIAGAKTAALRGGQFDLAKQFSQLGEDDQKAAKGRLDAAAPVAYQALKLPPEQRKEFILAHREGLLANGWTPQQIDGFEPTNEALGSIVDMASTLSQLRSADEIDYKVIPEGGSLEPFKNGQYIGSNPAVLRGASASPGGAPAPSPPPSASGGFTFNATPGAVVTSGTRSAAHNKAVGGVANSYHLTGQARDFVPPPGMSMAELHADMKRRNPTLDVINEGDHVHIEPMGNAPRQAAQMNADEIRARAQAAIAAGADPDAVKARAAQMGVSI